jgi:hypothetical protein
MSAATGLPLYSSNGPVIPRKPSPNDLSSRVASPPPTGSRHIADIDTEVQKRIAALSHAPVSFVSGVYQMTVSLIFLDGQAPTKCEYFIQLV